jgi:hypothetical protein
VRVNAGPSLSLLKAVNLPIFREGQWSLCDRTGWLDNASFQNLVAWNWVEDEERYLIVVNLSDSPGQARVQVPWTDAGGGNWHLIDALSGATYERAGDEMLSSGLHVELARGTTISSAVCATKRVRTDASRVKYPGPRRAISGSAKRRDQ